MSFSSNHPEFRATVTDTELLAAGIKEVEIASAHGARRMILAKGAKQQLIDRAVREARRKFDKDKPRGLFYILAKIFYPRRSSRRQRVEEIADAIDPTWQLIPSPTELRDDSGFDEIVGHLTLIQYNFECHRKVFSSDRNDWSHILIIVEPIAYNSATEKYNNTGDAFDFLCFSHFSTHSIKRDNGPATDRFGFFVTKTEGWVGKRMWWKAPLHGWMAWLSEKRNGYYQLLIFEPNFIGTPGQTVHKSEILPAQRLFIKHCFETWSRLRPDDVYLIWNTVGNPQGKCLQLCSEWLQKTLRDENWRNFPLWKEQITEMAAPIIWSDAGRKSNASSRQNSPPRSPPRTRSRSRSTSRSSSIARSRSASPTTGPSTRRPIRRQRSRLNMVSSAVHPVGDISVATADGYFDLDDNDLVTGIDMDDAGEQDPVLPLMEPSELLLVPSVTVSNHAMLDPEEEVLMAPTASVLGPNFESSTLSSVSSPSKAKKTRKEKKKKEKGKPSL